MLQANKIRLKGADLTDADLQEAKLYDADLSGANLTGASKVFTIFEGAYMAECVACPLNW